MFGSRSEALKAELAIKRLPKDKKITALRAPDFLGKAEPTTNDTITEEILHEQIRTHRSHCQGS